MFAIFIRYSSCTKEEGSSCYCLRHHWRVVFGVIWYTNYKFRLSSICWNWFLNVMFDGCHNLIMILVIFDLVQYVVALILDKDECVYYVFPVIFQNEF